MTLTVQTYRTVSAAGAALRSNPAARYFSGGTLMVRAANEGDTSFTTLIRATEPALTEIAVDGDSVRIGAAVTMSSVAAHPTLGFLARAARAVGGPAVRNMATVGGNLFAPAPYGDFAVALLALDAGVTSEDGRQPIDAFLAARDGPARSIVTAVDFAIPADGAFRFLKVSRVKPKGISVLSIAAVLDIEAGTVRSARIALGCMADRPIRARAAEAALTGCSLTGEGIRPALAAAREGTSPITDPIASAWYRSEVLPVHLGRLLLS